MADDGCRYGVQGPSIRASNCAKAHTRSVGAGGQAAATACLCWGRICSVRVLDMLSGAVEICGFGSSNLRTNVQARARSIEVPRCYRID